MPEPMAGVESYFAAPHHALSEPHPVAEDSRMVKSTALTLAAIFIASSLHTAIGADWPEFRGPNGLGISQDTEATPNEWSETRNVAWKVALPGPGSSSPIVVGDRLFVTCWTGYGMDREEPGDPSNLRRHLICIDRNTGDTIWQREVEAVLPEDRYQGMFTEHGYATHTPVSDGQHVFAFFGKTGVLAFDMQGTQLWQTSVGTDLGIKNWGTSSSPLLYEDLVIVPATAESRSMVALDKRTGKEVWRLEEEGFAGTWGSPILVATTDGRQELVISVPFEVWGLDPATGELLWNSQGIDTETVSPSAIAHDGIIFASASSRSGGGTSAIRAGGRGELRGENVLWETKQRARIGSPLFHDGRVYFVESGVIRALDADTGELILEERLPRSAQSEARSAARGRMGGMDYSSPVMADGKIYFVTRGGGTHVIQVGQKIKHLAFNDLGVGDEDFSATPAVSDGKIFIRSSKNLYCIGETL